MMLYSASLGVQSHSVRIVLFEKEVECRVEYVDSEGAPGDLVELNPYNETPTLVDRDLVLYGSQIINEYLDEGLPHPPLMPVDPVNRGRARLMMLRVQRDWLDLVKDFDSVELVRDNDDAQQMIRDGLIAVSPIFNEQAYMLGEEFSLVDCLMAPLLWRLPVYGITLPRQAKPILDYGERLFERASFLSSLSEAEHEIR